MGRTKADLADAVYKVHGGLSRREARSLVDVILDRIRISLKNGHPVLISGFGVFKVQSRRPRLGRNPRTGQPVPILPARRPVFRPSRLVVKGLNPARSGKGRSDA
jgi:nucleoid DNA-binding protein